MLKTFLGNTELCGYRFSEGLPVFDPIFSLGKYKYQVILWLFLPWIAGSNEYLLTLCPHIPELLLAVSSGTTAGFWFGWLSTPEASPGEVRKR